MADQSDEDLLNALGVDSEGKKKATRTPRQERIIAGFEDIQRFVEEHDKLPVLGENKDIFERLYAIRLLQIQKQAECVVLLTEYDHQGLLNDADADGESLIDELDDDALLSQLGVDAEKKNDLTQLKHVKPRAEIKAAEEVASRTKCEEFEKYRPVFSAVQQELESGVRETRPFKDYAEIKQGDWFILSGQKVYVAEMGETFITQYNRKDNRLRVIYDNGTESDILLRSLQRALNKDEAGRRIIERSLGPLFSEITTDEDLASGTIYVLRSLSKQPEIANHKDVLHKIGVTGGEVKKRIANAKKDPTFLLAEVEIVTEYRLYNINRTKLEQLIHRFFESAKLEIQIPDRFGQPVKPEEWFLVPLFVIDEFVDRVLDKTIQEYSYDATTAKLVENIR